MICYASSRGLLHTGKRLDVPVVAVLAGVVPHPAEASRQRAQVLSDLSAKPCFEVLHRSGHPAWPGAPRNTLESILHISPRQVEAFLQWRFFMDLE